MKFKVDKEVFNKIPNLYLGVVVGYDINNKKDIPQIQEMLNQGIQYIKSEIPEEALREYKYIVPYRDTFLKLEMNPNKYMCSIEALTKRVIKGNPINSINPIVDLVNALSLKYVLPMGAHDMDQFSGDIEIRFSNTDDTFNPLGTDEIETLDNQELVYASGNKIRTRRWIWRQSNNGKIEETSKNIFFPIDGFIDINKEKVEKAADELELFLQQNFNCRTKKFYIDINNNESEL